LPVFLGRKSKVSACFCEIAYYRSCEIFPETLFRGVVPAFQKPFVTLKVVPKGLGKKKQGSIPTSSENLSMRRVTQLVVEKSINFFKVDLLCAMGDSL
jgi:hypothetical protein